MAISPRQFRRFQKRAAKKIKQQMKTDINYLLKPKPKFLPRKIWLYLILMLLDLDPNKIK